MKMKLPVGSLAKLNWLLAVVFSGFVAIFVSAYLGFNSETVFSVIQTAISILLVGFVHLWVRVKLSRYKNRLSAKKHQLYQLTISYVATLIYSFCTSPLRKMVSDNTWKTITYEQQLITIIVGSLGVNIFILIMHNFLITYQAKSFAEVEIARLKLANAEAKNQLLKQQVHPHFLFNALNILKTLYKKDAAAGDTYIVHLANFLRAAISNTSAKVVSLADEIKLCTDYIAMQKIRFGNALQYNNYIFPAESREDFIPSFSLQPLLENAIKHNDVTDAQPLTIRVFKEDGYVVVENNLQRKKGPVVSTGSGLANLIKRYELLSGDEVIIQEEAAVFSVRLKILEA